MQRETLISVELISVSLEDIQSQNTYNIIRVCEHLVKRFFAF